MKHFVSYSLAHLVARSYIRSRMTETELYRNQLSQELARRCEKNPRYSVRAFAKALHLAPGALSQILSGKRTPSYKMAQRILSSLDFPPEQEDRFLASLAEAHRSRGLQRLSPAFKKYGKKPVVQELSLDLFRVISDWYHYAILELTFVDSFQSNPKWIARELGITATEAKLAIERLTELGLLEEKDGTLSKTAGTITTADKSLTSPALRRRQRQILEKAIHSLENDPIEVRSTSAMTMAIDPDMLPEAKTRIEKFTNELCDFLESGKRKRVYELGISLYPLQTSPSQKRTKGKVQ